LLIKIINGKLEGRETRKNATCCIGSMLDKVRFHKRNRAVGRSTEERMGKARSQKT
jgi:hypothetical protein